jgi:hypothetical protein
VLDAAERTRALDPEERADAVAAMADDDAIFPMPVA